MDGALGFLPLWALFFSTVAATLLSVILGFMAGRYRSRTSASADQGPVASIVGGTFALLAFVVVVSYGTAASNFEIRRQLVVQDASTIRTTYSIAALLPDPQSKQIRSILREYVTVRASGFQSGGLQYVLTMSEQLQDRLWVEAVAMEKTNPDSITDALFVQSLGELVDIHARRRAYYSQHVLPSVWIILYFVAVMAMVAFGYQCGLSGKYHRLAILTLVLAFSAVLWLLGDFDRPLSGTTRVSQQPMIELMQELNTPRD